jgi:hypothetical protein
MRADQGIDERCQGEEGERFRQAELVGLNQKLGAPKL